MCSSYKKDHRVIHSNNKLDEGANVIQKRFLMFISSVR